MDVVITTMGTFAVTVGGNQVDPAEWRRRQAAALIKVLALEPSHQLHREQVMDMLWPALTVEEAGPRLHKAAYYARRAVGHSNGLVLAGETAALFPRENIRVDAVEFQALADRALATRDPRLATDAVGAFGGELLPQDRYEAWAEEIRDRLQQCYLEVLRLSGQWELLSTVDPTDEDAHLRVITDLARRGERRSALRQFERLERALRQELGVAPSRAAITLRARLQAAEEAAADQFSPIPEQRPDRPTSASRGQEPVGRAAECARISDLLGTITSGKGRTLFLSGRAGVGKTALLAWLEEAAGRRGLRVGSGVAAHVEGAWPYAPVLEALADLCHRHPALLDGLDDVLRAEIESGLSGRVVVWNAQSGHQRLFVAAAELLRLAAAGSGAVLIVDDAHQCDEASLRLLHYLARSTVADRVLLVLTHRPEVTAALAQIRQSLFVRRTAVTLEVEPLRREDVSVLVRQVSPQADEDFVDAVWAASEGVPFSVIELARSGPTRSSMSAASLLPVMLTDEQAQVLAAAAVLGSTFDTDEFVEVSGLSETAAYGVLDAAVAHRVLTRTDTGYCFRHNILRDGLLRKLLPSAFRVAHRKAAAALEILGRSPARIGHHLVKAGDQSAAVSWLLQAAEIAAALGANREALATLESVRERAQGADLAQLMSLRADLLMASADAGTVGAYREALALATEASDRARLRARLARAAAFAGDIEVAAIALDGLVLDGSAHDTEVLLSRGIVAFLQGDLPGVDAAASEARRRVALGRPDEWQTFELVALQGFVAHNRGEWFQRLRLELRTGVRQPALAARIFDGHLCVAEYLLYGPTPYVEVLELAASLRETAERAGVLRAVAFATALRGETALLMGDLELAGAELQDAVDLHRDIGSAAGEALSLQRLAEVKLALGDRIDANRLLLRALPIARFTSVALHLMQRIYGTMITAAADPFAARAIVDHAEAALGVDDRCLFCVIMLALPAARACADVGDLDDARRYLQVATHSAQMWEGTAWQAAVLETRAHLAAATGDLAEANLLRRSATELFGASGQPLDAQRCAVPLAAVPSALSSHLL